jgi:hypothetical protein
LFHKVAYSRHYVPSSIYFRQNVAHVFRKYPVWVLAGTLTILSDSFRGFPQNLTITRHYSVIILTLLATCLLAGSCWYYFFDPEDGGDMFLRNVCCNWTGYTASYSRRWYFS